MTITETLRAHLGAVLEKGDVTRYRIAKDCRVSWQSLARFVDGGNLRGEQLDLLGDYLKLELVAKSQSAPDTPKKKSAKNKRE